MTQTPDAPATGSEAGAAPRSDDTDRAIAWLRSQFPEWSVEVESTATWRGHHRPVWIARAEGHHPQAELSPAKLHTRLSEYLDREQQRRAAAN